MPASLLLRVLAFSLISAAALAQTAAQQKTDQQPKKTKSRSFENKVLDLVSPNRLVVEGRDTKGPPLSTAQKFSQVEKNFINPFTFAGVAIEAGFDQAIDVHHGYGGGGQGYLKRYGADLADTASAQFFGIGVYPSLFHTDPRYYRMGNGTFTARAVYSITRVLSTRTDSGHERFNAPEILAAATSSGLSRTYYPADERTVGDFAYSMGSRIAFDAAYNLTKEFWPDVRTRLFGRPK
ncbi:MAG TPA: hypothetical protein VJT08_01935 [Terriglobales bacterium]|nr:hypothetical protein [Terriglobales bacterium]